MPARVGYRIGRGEVLDPSSSFGAEIRDLNAPSGLHGHDFVELAVVVSGSGRHVTAAGAWAVRPGDAVAVRACDWHGWEEPRALRVANVYVDQLMLRSDIPALSLDPALRALAWPVPGMPTAPGIAHLDATALTRVHDSIDALATHERAGSVAALGHALVVLGTIADALGRLSMHEPHPAVLHAVRLLGESLAADWTVAALGRAVGLSEGHLSRLFHRAFGAAPMQVLAGLRAEQAAARLITSNAPVAEVGRRVGWPDPNYFARRFRARYGVSPREYRARFR
jgi:AraC family transcriptional regulator, L-rhamnose operon transcriptional activator RhaR